MPCTGPYTGRKKARRVADTQKREITYGSIMGQRKVIPRNLHQDQSLWGVGLSTAAGRLEFKKDEKTPLKKMRTESPDLFAR